MATEGSHWVRWHEEYDKPESPLSLRLEIVQGMVRDFLDAAPPGPVRIVSLCAGQGRDVVGALDGHPRAADVRALLVELDPELVDVARRSVGEAGLTAQVRVVEGDASLCNWYAADVPADLVLVCGVFGNISQADIDRTIAALPGFCREGSEVIWTRHRREPDATPAIRAAFAVAGFDERAFEAPEGYVLSVGRERLCASAGSFDPAYKLFDFVGDGSAPA